VADAAGVGESETGVPGGAFSERCGEQQYAGRILRPFPGKATAEIHDYYDTATSVLASSLAKRAPGYTSLGFPDPRRIPHTPSSRAAREFVNPSG